MTNLRLTGMTVGAAEAIEPHIRALYDGPTARRLIVGEVEHVERTQPGPASGKQPTVVCRLAQLEVPTDKQAPIVRDVLRALYLLRTAKGTFDEVSGTVNLAGEAQKLASATSLLYVDDALQARAMLRMVRDQLNAITDGAAMEPAKQRRAIRKTVALLSQFVENGRSVEHLLPELAAVGQQLSLVEDDEGEASDGAVDVTEPRHDAGEALAEQAGQDVGTRVPAPSRGVGAHPPFVEPAEPTGADA